MISKIPFLFFLCIAGAIAVHSDEFGNSCCPTIPAPPVCCSDQVIVRADFLWWKANVEGTGVAEFQYAVSGSLPFGPIVSQYKELAPEGKWEPGARVELGYQFNRFDNWKLSLLWTYLFTNSEIISQSATGTGQALYPLTANIVGPRALNVNAHWNLKTNLVDLELSNEFYPTAKLSLTPHIGGRGAFFNFHFYQSFEGLWLSFIMTPPLIPQVEPTSDHSSFSFDGGGLKMGLDGNWHFSDSWSLLACLSGSLIYGKYDITHKIIGFGPDPVLDGGPALFPLSETFFTDMWRVRTNLEAFLGLKWDTCWCNGKYQFSLAAGYEISQWFQLNSIPGIIDEALIYNQFNGMTPETAFDVSIFENTNFANISYQGLTARASFDF